MNTVYDENKIDDTNIEDTTIDDTEEVKYDDIQKVTTKFLTPLIVLSCTAIVAIFTYFKRYPAGDFFVIVFASVVIFLVIALIIEKMVNRFLEINYEKAVAERMEAERLEEEARAAMEAEGGEDIEAIDDQNMPPQF